MMQSFGWWVGVAIALGAMGGCHAAERAAAKDPMTCERNPNCAAQRGAYADCTKQCVDNPECMDRCQQATVDQSKH
jgi:hypothetical protein